METVLMVGLAKFTNTVASGLGTAPDFEPPQSMLARVEEAAGSNAA